MEIIYTTNEVKNLGGEPGATTLLNVTYFVSDVAVNKKKSDRKQISIIIFPLILLIFEWEYNVSEALSIGEILCHKSLILMTFRWRNSGFLKS